MREIPDAFNVSKTVLSGKRISKLALKGGGFLSLGCRAYSDSWLAQHKASVAFWLEGYMNAHTHTQSCIPSELDPDEEA